MYEDFLRETNRPAVLAQLEEALYPEDRDTIMFPFLNEYNIWLDRHERGGASEENLEEILRQQEERAEKIASRPLNCQIVIANSEGYEAFPDKKPLTETPWQNGDSADIMDATYVENKNFEDFPSTNKEILIVVSIGDRKWQGLYFQREDFIEWISDPHNVVARCKNESEFDYFVPGRATSALFVRLDLMGATYYVPYIDLRELCSMDHGQTYLLEETNQVLTSIVSFSVMRHGTHVSAQHCKDLTEKPVYRLVQVKRSLFVDEDEEVEYDFGDDEGEYEDEDE